MVVNAVRRRSFSPRELIRRLADRHVAWGFTSYSVGAVALRSNPDFHYRIFTAHGSEVSQCGNRARCFARFVRRRKG
ncbi:hypothetical protein ACNKHO_24335 [Shigella flexneri]